MPKLSPDLVNLLTMCERGNTLLVNEDNLAFLARLNDNQTLIVEYIANNYPSLNITISDKTDEELVAIIQEVYEGWTSTKWNLTVPARTYDGVISTETDEEEEPTDAGN